MRQQTLVVGLGLFGMALARARARQGNEVLAVDIDPRRVAAAGPYVASVATVDAMEESALADLSPKDRDTCVCAIGNDNREASIIVTALLKQLGARKLIARATDDLHARILRHVGADEIVRPERSVGERLAIRLAWRNVVNVLPLVGDLNLTEVEAPESLWGRTLHELELPSRFSIVVSGIRRRQGEEMLATIPDPSVPIREGDILMVVGTETNTKQFTESM